VVDNGYLIKKLALSSGPTPAGRSQFPARLSLFMALGAVGFGRLAESLFPVVAYAAVLILPVSLLGHFQVLFLHGENLGVAVGAFALVRCHVALMTECDWVRTLGGKLDVPSPDLLRLGKSDAQDGEAYDTDGDNRNFPGSILQFSSPFRKELMIIQISIFYATY
jgi:hypothetical protein